MKRLEDLWTRLRADGLRRTPQREAIVEVLADAGAALPGVVGRANEAGLQLRSVDIQEPNLEAVFLHLTGRGLRD